MPYTPEQFPFIGPEKDNPAAAARFAEIIAAGWSFEGEVKPTADELTEIANVHTAIGIVGDELGVDLRSRLPQPGEEILEAYKFFDDPKAFDAAVHRVNPRFNATGGAMYVPGMGVLYLRPEGGSHMGLFRSMLSHEDDHMVAQMTVEPQLWVPDGQTASQIKFAINYTYSAEDYTKGGFRESVTDLGADRQTRVRGEKDLNYSYGPVDLLLDGIVQKVAAAQGMDPKELGDLILKGQYTGDMTGIGLIAEKLPPADFNRLTATDGDMSYDGALRLAEATRLDTVVAQIKAYKTHDYRQRPFAWNEPADGYRLHLPQAQQVAPGHVQPAPPRETIIAGNTLPETGTSSGFSGPGSAIERAAAGLRTALTKAEASMAAQVPAYVALDTVQDTVTSVMEESSHMKPIAELLGYAQQAIERASSYQDRGCSHLDDYLGTIGMAATGTPKP